MRYQVIVGNVGTVIDTDEWDDALKEVNEYVKLSKSGYGRVSGETVTLIEDGEIIAEHKGAVPDGD